MRKLILSTLAATAVATAACGGDSSTGPSSSVAGSYALQTVNSQSLPFVIQDDVTGKVEILSDSYSVTANGAYTNQTVVRTTLNGAASTQSISSSGTYTRSGNSITLTDSSDPTDKVTATVSASAMTISVDGFVLVYQRSGS